MWSKAVVGAIVVVFPLSVGVLAKGIQEESIRLPDTFLARREALMDSVAEGIAVLYSQGRRTETGYRADGNFWYLTGVDEPGAILLLAPQERDRQVLFLPPRDIEDEQWTGRRPALTDSLRRELGFDQIWRTGMLDRVLISYMKHSTVLHLVSSLVGPSRDVPPDLELYRKITARVPGTSIKNSSHLLETMRMVKSPEEIAAIEQAIRVTYQGMTEVLA
ncbi:MAG: aminopeptidase P N-terminal domain-containing protein, partial [Phycisphaerales bacterium]